MDIRSIYFDQVVTETDMNGLQTAVETAIKRILGDLLLPPYACILTGLGVYQTDPVSMGVRIAAGLAYQATLERVAVPAEIDSGDVPGMDMTSLVPTVAGQSRWVCLSLAFDRNEYDPRLYVDRLGVAQSVNYRQDESYRVTVTPGGAAGGGGHVRPSIPSGEICLADVELTHGMTGIVQANIDIARRTASWELVPTLTRLTQSQVMAWAQVGYEGGDPVLAETSYGFDSVARAEVEGVGARGVINLTLTSPGVNPASVCVANSISGATYHIGSSVALDGTYVQVSTRDGAGDLTDVSFRVTVVGRPYVPV